MSSIMYGIVQHGSVSYDAQKGPVDMKRGQYLIGKVFFFDALDLGQARDPHGGYVEPFAGHMKRLLPKFWTFLRYLQKKQGAMLTMADNLHLLAHNVAS